MLQFLRIYKNISCVYKNISNSIYVVLFLSKIYTIVLLLIKKKNTVNNV